MNRMKIKMGNKVFCFLLIDLIRSFFLCRVITEEEFIRGCMADRVLYQMLTADTSDPDR
jgi:hypothetical protein